MISAFYKDVYTRGAVIFGVCRGKISEGLDFSDEAARAVVLVGIPFPMLVDPKTILKKDYLDKRTQRTTPKNGPARSTIKQVMEGAAISPKPAEKP